MTKPRYQDIVAADIPEVTDDDGTRVRIIIGDFLGKSGPVEGVAAEPRYLDVSVPPGKKKRFAVDRANNAFAYVFAGSGTFRDASEPQAVATEIVSGPNDGAFDLVTNRSLVLFDRGDEIVVQAGDEGIRFLLVAGKPLEEPVAWRGPIVMNSNWELQQAYAELRAGTFIK
jgi:quercetin 2,3-dioxygenase